MIIDKEREILTQLRDPPSQTRLVTRWTTTFISDCRTSILMAGHFRKSQPLPTTASPGPGPKLSSTAQRNQSFLRQLSSFHQSLLPPDPALWPSQMEPPLKKRRSNGEIRRESPGDTKQQGSSNQARIIVISDNEDADGSDPVVPAPAQLDQPAHSMPAMAMVPPSQQVPLLDPFGRPLSDAAIAIAHAYWYTQREIDTLLLDGTEDNLPFQHLLQSAHYRREYTRIVLGLPQFEPKTKTYEPVYVEPPPQGIGLQEFATQ